VLAEHLAGDAPVLLHRVSDLDACSEHVPVEVEVGLDVPTRNVENSSASIAMA
jgi:hypothetical protein